MFAAVVGTGMRIRLILFIPSMTRSFVNVVVLSMTSFVYGQFNHDLSWS